MGVLKWIILILTVFARVYDFPFQAERVTFRADNKPYADNFRKLPAFYDKGFGNCRAAVFHNSLKFYRFIVACASEFYAHVDNRRV